MANSVKMIKFNLIGLAIIINLSLNFVQTQVAFQSLDCDLGAQGNWPYCNWKTLGGWKINSGLHFPDTGIQFDGPSKPPVHYKDYIYVYASNSQMITPNADLNSPILLAKTTTDCFSFFYYIHGEGVGQVNLIINTNGKDEVVWTRKHSAGDMWHLNKINIGPQSSSYKILFSGSSASGAIGLAYLKTTAGPCSPESLCDFESGNCNWTTSSSSPNYQFKLIAASSQNDHTTESEYGHLMKASGGNKGDVANLISPTFIGFESQYCLRFWYWRHSSQLNKIEVLTSSPFIPNPITKWTSNYTFPIKTWHRAQVDLNMFNKEKIIIRATHLASQVSPVDIDDISIVPGHCTPAVTCDFDTDLCGWTRNLNEWSWDHGIGRVEYSNVLPSSIKYTPKAQTGTDGMFLYSDFTLLGKTLNWQYPSATMNLKSEFVPAISGSCLTFYYLPLNFNTDKSEFHVKLNDVNDNPRKTLITLPNATSSNWLKAQVGISATQAFRIVLQLTTKTPSTYLAIDNIKYESGDCNSVKSTLPSIPATISPSSSPACDFEKNTLCNWVNKRTFPTNAVWKVGFYNPSSKWPRTDHTKNSGYGHFAYIDHTSLSNLLKLRAEMDLTFVNNRVSGDPVVPFCFTLWYFMSSGGYGQLNITAKGGGNTVLSAISRESGQGANQWNQLQFEIPGDEKAYVYSIIALAKLAVVAIDDITFTHQSCQQGNPNIFRCTFEGGHNCSFAPVYRFQDVGVHWDIYKGNETNIQAADHTLRTKLGHYFAMDFDTLGENRGAVTYNYKFISEYFRPSSQSCVTFSYFMTGLLTNETLSFYMVNSTISPTTGTSLWTATGDMGRFWYSHRMTVSSNIKWKIEFGVETHQTKKGLVAIDDVIVNVGIPCPPKGFCDFERKDTCMWESVPPNKTEFISQTIKMSWANINVGARIYYVDLLRITDFEWVVHSPDGSPSSLYPSIDHTLGKASGNYLLLQAQSPRISGDRAILVSDHYDIDSNRSFCLQFYYYFKNDNSAGSCRFEIYQNENGKVFKKIGQVIGTTPSTSWTKFAVTAKQIDSFSKNMWFHLLGDVGTIDSAIAIDDISIASGNCVADDSFLCKPSTERIPKSKVCDGNKDCANGADELDCGSCDFANNDLCGFTESSSRVNNGHAFRLGNSTADPKSDPNGGTNFVVAQSYVYSRYLETSNFYSPSIYGADAGCIVYFYYNMNGNMSNVLPNNRWSHLKIILNRPGESNEIWNSDAFNPVHDHWIKAHALIGRVRGKFSLSYIASDGSPTIAPGQFGYVALANIKMSGCTTNKTNQPSVCPSNMFSCGNGKCISKNYICDYADDCGDLSDESYVVCSTYKQRCDFENGLCEWGRYQKDSWKIDSGYSFLTQGPTRDHTKGIKTGKYLLLKSLANSDTTAELSGPTLEPSNNCRIRFWYSMEGNSTNNGKLYLLYVTLHQSPNFVMSHWATEPEQFPTLTFGFNRVEVTIGRMSGTTRIYFRGVLSAHGNVSAPSYIALDDISLSPECILSAEQTGQSSTTPAPIRTTKDPCGSQFTCKSSGTLQCIDMTKVCDFHNDCTDGSDEQDCGTCDFERADTTTGKPSMCGWADISFGKMRWSAVSVSTLLNNVNLPRKDASGKSTGHFLIIDSNSGGTSTTLPATIATPKLGRTAPSCKIQFSYRHTYPSSTYFSLTVSLYRRLVNRFVPFNKILMTIIDNTDWKSYQVQIGELAAGYQVKIASGSNAIYPNIQPYNDIELDNIKFVDCDPTASPSPSTLSCDFENGTCGWFDWNMGSNNKIDWVRTYYKNWPLVMTQYWLFDLA